MAPYSTTSFPQRICRHCLPGPQSADLPTTCLRRVLDRVLAGFATIQLTFSSIAVRSGFCQPAGTDMAYTVLTLSFQGGRRRSHAGVGEMSRVMDLSSRWPTSDWCLIAVITKATEVKSSHHYIWPIAQVLFLSETLSTWVVALLRGGVSRETMSSFSCPRRSQTIYLKSHYW